MRADPWTGQDWDRSQGGPGWGTEAAWPVPRSDASREELAELAQQVNPEEIQLGEDEDEDEMDLEPNGEGPAGAGTGAGPGWASGTGQRQEGDWLPPSPQRFGWSSRACPPQCSGA